MRSDEGAMAVAMVGVVAVVTVLAVAVAALGTLYAARAQAANAADAAALAAAVSSYPPASALPPLTAARHVAEANGAVVVACRCPRDPGLDHRTVEVMTAISVEVPIFGRVQVRSVARAEFDPVLWLGR